MPSVELLRPYIEKLLAEWLHTDDLVVDDDGDVPIRYGSALYYVSLVDRDPPLLRVWAAVLHNVPKSMELLDAVNSANCHMLQCRMFWHDDALMVATEIVAEDLGREELIEACRAIAAIADELDDEFQPRFGGEKAFDDEGVVPAS